MTLVEDFLGKKLDRDRFTTKAKPSCKRDLVIRCTYLLGVFSEFVQTESDPEAAAAILLSLHVSRYSHKINLDWASEDLFYLCKASWNSTIIKDKHTRRVVWTMIMNWSEMEQQLMPLLSQAVTRQTLDSLSALLKDKIKLTDKHNLLDIMANLTYCVGLCKKKTVMKTRFDLMPMDMGDGSYQNEWHDSLWSQVEKDEFFAIDVTYVPLTECSNPYDFVVALADCPGVCGLLNRARRDLHDYPLRRDWKQAAKVQSWSDLLSHLSRHTGRSYDDWEGAPLILRKQVLFRAVLSMYKPCCDLVEKTQKASQTTAADKCANSKRSRLTTVLMPNGSTTKMISMADKDKALLMEMGWPGWSVSKWEGVFDMKRVGDTIHLQWGVFGVADNLEKKTMKFECPITYDDIDDPVLLDCTHVLGLETIRTTMRKQDISQYDSLREHNGMLTCPLCRRKTNVSDLIKSELKSERLRRDEEDAGSEDADDDSSDAPNSPEYSPASPEYSAVDSQYEMPDFSL